VENGVEIYFPAMFSGFNLVASIREGTTAKNKTKFMHGADLKVKIMLYVAWQLFLERTWK